jgi:uncharacterized OsmC-like protein
MQVNLSHKTNFQFLITARGHLIVCDRPCQIGGDDAGMTPLELYLAALGSCIAFYVLEYFKARGLDTKVLDLDVSVKEITNQPSCEIQLRLPQDLIADHRKGLEQAVETSLIHNAFIRPPKLITRIVNTPLPEKKQNSLVTKKELNKVFSHLNNK